MLVVVRRVAGLVALLMALLPASPTLAQERNLVGTWSMQVYNPAGSGVVFTTFRQDGGFSQRWVIPMRESDYSGTYQLSRDGNTLQWVYRDYNPKNIPPMIQMDTPVSTSIQWVSANIFLTQDAGGTNRWVRQPQ